MGNGRAKLGPDHQYLNYGSVSVIPPWAVSTDVIFPIVLSVPSSPGHLVLKKIVLSVPSSPVT